MQVGKKNKVKKAVAKNVEDDSVSSGTEQATNQHEVHDKDMLLIKSYNQRAMTRSTQADPNHEQMRRLEQQIIYRNNLNGM